MVQTNEERKAQQREYYQKNKEKLKADSKKRYLKNHEKNIQYRKDWYAKNRERELERRKVLRLPPFSAQAEISGTSAEAFMNLLGKPENIKIMGPRDKSWLVQAENSEDLAELLNKAERPSGRLRIQVDPQNI